MTAVFSHGRLRLYLLKLLEAGPKHGYELIRLLENRFFGLYAPSAGTIYPRLSRMEADGLVTHAAAGGRKVYEITDAGRAELVQRQDELEALESEIHASVADLAAIAEEVEEGVRGSVRMLKQELRQAARDARPPRAEEWRYWRDAWRSATSSAEDLGGPSPPPTGPGAPGGPPGGGPPGGATPGGATPGGSTTGGSTTGGGGPTAPSAADVLRKVAELADEVSRLVRLGRATAEELRVAGTVLDSVRDQLRDILRR
jgi:DNA-binding PadR family transcriptional regulator